MTLTINTNISSLIAQRSLNNATDALTVSMERMTTGYTINHASDNAAGYSIANEWTTQLSSIDVASANASTGADMLTTAEDTYSLLTDHLQRIRDLTEQAANGTYGSQSLKAIQSEIHARLQEVSRIAMNSEFNGIKLMAYTQDGDGSGITSDGLNLQVGLHADSYSVINLSVKLFSNATVSGLFNGMLSEKSAGGVKTLSQLLQSANNGTAVTNINSEDGLQAFASACAGLIVKKDTTTGEYSYTLQGDAECKPTQMLTFLDDAINEISHRTTEIGSAQNRIDSAISALDVQSQNITSSLSTLRDTDIASESSNYLSAQILQQASATLLATANQLPSIALNLL